MKFYDVLVLKRGEHLKAITGLFGCYDNGRNEEAEVDEENSLFGHLL
jgi:hypothetical protein